MDDARGPLLGLDSLIPSSSKRCSMTTLLLFYDFLISSMSMRHDKVIHIPSSYIVLRNIKRFIWLLVRGDLYWNRKTSSSAALLTVGCSVHITSHRVFVGDLNLLVGHS